MTVSMRVMSAGAGYQYLLRSVAAGDGNRQLSTPLTRYYTEAGTPPGRWLGSGLHAFGNGEIRQGDVVGEQQLALLLGTGSDPVTGEPLGAPRYPRCTIAKRPTEYGVQCWQLVGVAGRRRVRPDRSASRSRCRRSGASPTREPKP